MDRDEPTSSSGRNDIEATVPNEFAYLPNEIIHDVVDSHGEERRTIYYKLKTLVEIEGSWGEFARELSACTEQRNKFLNYASVLFCSRVFDRVASDFCEKQVSYEEIKNQFICSSSINGCFGLDLLMTVAPKLYEVISICRVPDTYCKALNLMGNRFSSVCWRGNNPNEAATPELVTFLRRQLLSNYLRQLTVFNVKFEDGAFDDQMEVFVKRPSFEYLSMGSCSYPVSFQLFKEAYKAWLAPRAFEFENRALYAYCSRDTVEKLEEYFKTKFEFKWVGNKRISKFILEHSVHNTLQMCLRVFKEADDHMIDLKFSGF